MHGKVKVASDAGEEDISQGNKSPYLIKAIPHVLKRLTLHLSPAGQEGRIFDRG